MPTLLQKPLKPLLLERSVTTSAGLAQELLLIQLVRH